MNTTEYQKLCSLAEQVCERESCRLYDLEFVSEGPNRILRIYIERAGDQTVSLEDCSNVSRGLSLQLDVEDIVPGGAYMLEVSSPGINRLLKQPWHFARIVGENIRVKLKRPLAEVVVDAVAGMPESWQKRKQFEAKLQASGESYFEANIDKVTVKVGYQDIEKANLLVAVEDILKKQEKKGFAKGAKGARNN